MRVDLKRTLKNMSEGIKRDEEEWDLEEKQLVESLRIIKLLKQGLVVRKKSLEEFLDDLEKGGENGNG